MKAALIGLGNVAWKYDGGSPKGRKVLTHMSTLRKANITINVGFDTSAQVRKQFSQSTGVSTTDCLEDALSGKPDIVCIASPSSFHAKQASACIDAGVKYIWLEKPATQNLQELDELSAKADNANCRIMVGYQRRYMPIYQELAKKDFGQIRGVQITYSKGLETNGVHLLDLLVWLMNERAPRVKSVFGCTEFSSHQGFNPSFLLEGHNEIPITVSGMTLNYHSIDMVVHYESGRRSVRHSGETYEAEIVQENKDYKGFFKLLRDQTNPQPISPKIQAAEVFSTMLIDLISKKKKQPLSNLQTAKNCQIIIDEVMQRCR